MKRLLPSENNEFIHTDMKQMDTNIEENINFSKKPHEINLLENDSKYPVEQKHTHVILKKIKKRV